MNVMTRPVVGITTYRDVDERHRTLEIGGTWLGRPWWRTAINTEAKLLFLGHAFETLGANRVAIKTDIRNERSQAASFLVKRAGGLKWAATWAARAAPTWRERRRHQRSVAAARCRSRRR